MARILLRIQSQYGTLPGAERCVADHIRGHPDTALHQSVHEVAKAAGVSAASVSRMARRLGCASFKEFKIQLACDSANSVSAIYEAISKDDSDAEIIRKVFGGNVRSLNQTLEMLDPADMVRAARAVARCRRVAFFGIGASGNTAQEGALRLAHLDVPAEACIDSYRIVNQAVRLTKGDVAVGVSHSGRSVVTVKALELARRGGATTVGISNYLKSPLHEASDIFLCTSFSESRVKAAALSSQIAQICLLDAMYVLVARYRKTRIGLPDVLNSHIESLLRLPVKPRAGRTRNSGKEGTWSGITIRKSS